jgi:lipopolysaccharide biosynthesis glycosyltransferase
LESDVTDYAKQRLEFLKYQFSNFKIEWINVEPEKIFAGLSVDTANGTKHSWNGYYDIWTRFLIPEIKSDINKALYLDYDIIAMSDIKELWEQDLENFELGGVADFCNLNRKDIDCSEKHIYFGSGILLMDTQKMRETNFFERILKVVKEYNPKLIYPDQDALNIYYANGNYKLLEYRFGYLQNSKKRIKQGVSLKGVEDYYTKTDKIVIKHFNGQKPWNIIEAENSNEWWYYAKISPFFMDIVENFMKKGCNFRMF